MIYAKKNFPGTYIRVNQNTITEEKFDNLKLLYPTAMIILEREDIKNRKFLYSFNELTYRKNDFERFYLRETSKKYDELFSFDIGFKSTYQSFKIIKNLNNIFYDFKIETKKNSNLFTWEEIPTNLLGETR
ncbi:MAG: hypothetical protein ACRCZ0_11740 [Cetobacterium sp.]